MNVINISSNHSLDLTTASPEISSVAYGVDYENVTSTSSSGLFSHLRDSLVVSTNAQTLGENDEEKNGVADPTSTSLDINKRTDDPRTLKDNKDNDASKTLALTRSDVTYSLNVLPGEEDTTAYNDVTKKAFFPRHRTTTLKPLTSTAKGKHSFVLRVMEQRYLAKIISSVVHARYFILKSYFQ